MVEAIGIAEERINRLNRHRNGASSFPTAILSSWDVLSVATGTVVVLFGNSWWRHLIHSHDPHAQPLEDACPPVRRTSSRSSQFLSGVVPICKGLVVGEPVELMRRTFIR